MNIFEILRRVGDTLEESGGRVLKKSNKDDSLYRNIDISSGLEVEPSVANGWKTRGSIPWSKLLEFSLKHNISLVWLLTGKEPIYSGSIKTDEGTEDRPDIEQRGPPGDFGRAAEMLRDIYASKEPVAGSAINSNLFMICEALECKKREQKALEELNDIKSRLEMDRRQGERRCQDLGPPGKIERRTGQDRRHFIRSSGEGI